MAAPHNNEADASLRIRAEQSLRQRAEALALKQQTITSKPAAVPTLAALRDTLHELQVHQIELELQNEELRRTHLELDAARARYFDLYDLAPLAYCTVSESGLILEANIAAATLLDISRRDLVDQRLSRFISSEHQDTYYLCRQQLLSSGQQQTCELEMRKGDGSLFWVQMAATAVATEEGLIELRLIMTDITANKLLLAEVQRHAQLYDVAFNLAPTGMAYLSLDGRFTTVNAHMSRLSGYSTAELLRMKTTDITHPDDAAADRLLLDQFFHGDLPIYENEKRYVRKNGSICWVSVVARIIHDTEGCPLHSVGVVQDISLRKNAEFFLKETQSRLHRAAEAAKLTYVEVNLAQGNATCAENFVAVMGYLPPQNQASKAGAQALLDHILPIDRPKVDTALGQFIGGMTDGRIDYRVLGDDGVERSIESTWSVERSANGTPIKSFVTNLDITDRRRIDQALRDSEERYRNLFESMDEGYCTIEVIFDAQNKPVDYVFLEMNPAFEALTGLNNAAGKGARELLPDLEESWFDIYGKVALTGTPLRFINEAKVLNRWFDVYSFRIGNPDSHKVAILFNNITEQRRNVEALRESEERYRTLFESIDEGFCIIEVLFDEHQVPNDYRFIVVNPTFVKQTGLLEASGKRVRELIPNLETHWFETFGKVAMTGEATRYVNVAKGLDGRWFDVYACRVAKPEDRRVAVIFTDITARRNAELQRDEFDQLLRHKNADLERATLVAETANRAKSDFLSGMSHELRTPLSTILGFAQLIESGTPPPTPIQKRSVMQILQAGWYLLELINEILDLALVESGKLAIQLQPVLLSDVMQESRAMIELQADQRGISVSFPAFNKQQFVMADSTRVKQILINLLSNAIKYNRVNGWVKVTCGETATGRIRIGVENSGDGLAPEQVARLFEPFNRLGQEAMAEQGTGIGLVMSKRLVEMMGGLIGVESEVGRGCIFWIELDPSHVLAASGATLPGRAHPPAQAFTLLYVEDQLVHLAVMQEFVASHPEFRLLTANNGADAIAIARLERPAVMVLDINLPGISGIEVQEILASDAATADIPIVALTAYLLDHHIDAGGDARFFAYLSKPIQLNALLETLELALEHTTVIDVLQPEPNHDHH